MRHVFSSSHYFSPRHLVLFVLWCDVLRGVHGAGTRKRAIVEDHLPPFRALTSVERLWSNTGLDNLSSSSASIIVIGKVVADSNGTSG
jgi:hypothetical protein